MPNHRVASGAKRTVWSPTRIGESHLRWRFLLEKRMASVFDSSKRTALLLAHSSVAAAHRSSL